MARRYWDRLQEIAEYLEGKRYEEMSYAERSIVRILVSEGIMHWACGTAFITR